MVGQPHHVIEGDWHGQTSTSWRMKGTRILSSPMSPSQETRDHSLAEFLTVSGVSQKRTVGCPFPNGKRKKTRRFVRTGKPCKDFCCCCRKAGETQKNWKGDRLKDSSRLWRLRLPFQMQSILKFLLKIHTGESFYATVRGKLSDNIPNSILYWASRKDFHIF